MHLGFSRDYPRTAMARKSVCSCVLKKTKLNSCRVHQNVRLPDCSDFVKLTFVPDERLAMRFHERL